MTKSINITYLKHKQILNLFFVAFLLLSNLVSGQRMTRKEYINKYSELAINQMKHSGIPASIIMAQALLESDNGNSMLAVKANNHFGIKCHDWDGKSYFMDDDEANECFRKYKNPVDSYRDHSLFLTSRERYALLFELDITDYKGWAKGLKKAGYATNPKYADLLINIIEEYDLNKLDQVELDEIYATEIKTETKDDRTYISAIDADSHAPVKIGGGGRKIYINNGVKYIIAREDDSFYSIATDLIIYTYQVYKYNDLQKNDKIEAGEILYVEKKRNKGLVGKHTVGEGETLRSISQLYAVKIKSLRKMNGMKKDESLPIGKKLYIR